MENEGCFSGFGYSRTRACISYGTIGLRSLGGIGLGGFGNWPSFRVDIRPALYAARLCRSYYLGFVLFQWFAVYVLVS